MTIEQSTQGVPIPLQPVETLLRLEKEYNACTGGAHAKASDVFLRCIDGELKVEKKNWLTRLKACVFGKEYDFDSNAKEVKKLFDKVLQQPFTESGNDLELDKLEKLVSLAKDFTALVSVVASKKNWAEQKSDEEFGTRYITRDLGICQYTAKITKGLKQPDLVKAMAKARKELSTGCASASDTSQVERVYEKYQKEVDEGVVQPFCNRLYDAFCGLAKERARDICAEVLDKSKALSNLLQYYNEDVDRTYTSTERSLDAAKRIEERLKIGLENFGIQARFVLCSDTAARATEFCKSFSSENKVPKVLSGILEQYKTEIEEAHNQSRHGSGAIGPLFTTLEGTLDDFCKNCTYIMKEEEWITSMRGKEETHEVEQLVDAKERILSLYKWSWATRDRETSEKIQEALPNIYKDWDALWEKLEGGKGTLIDFQKEIARIDERMKELTRAKEVSEEMQSVKREGKQRFAST